MIIAKARSEDGEDVFVIGLSFAQLDRLRAGDSQNIHSDKAGITIHVIAGRDQPTLLQMFRSLLPKITSIREVP